MVTLHSLLESGRVPIRPISTGWNAARAVSHVTVIEDVNVRGWMRGKELLLVGMSTLSRIDDLVRFVEELVGLRCSALVIKCGSDESSPEGLVEVCNVQRLPLFEIEPGATYLDVMSPINELLVRDEQRSFFDAIVAHALIDSPIPALDGIELAGVSDLSSEYVIVCHTSVFPPANCRLTAEDVAQRSDTTQARLEEELASLKETGAIDAYVILADALEMRALLLLPDEPGTRRVYDTLRSNLDKSLSFPIGVSRPCACPQAPLAAAQARFAFKTSDLLGSHDHMVRFYQDVEFFHLVEEIASSSEASAMFAQTDVLADHPKLFETLTAFFSQNEQLKPTSEQLFIHINTLRYRLDQVTRLTGLDWTSTPDKVRLFLGVVRIRQRRARNQHGPANHSG